MIPSAADQPVLQPLANALNRKHLVGLDAIRAVSAFLVVFYHSGVPFINGGLGVLAFFVLSGFLITWLLLDEQERHGEISLRNFYIRRSLRIFPAFYCYWGLLIAALWLTGKRLIWPQAWASFFYVNNYWQGINGDPGTGLSHTWSLAVEEQFYLLWPIALIWLEKRKRTWKVLLWLIPSLWVFRLLLKHVFGVWQGYIYESMETRADHLLIGAILAVALFRGKWQTLWPILIAGPWRPLLTVLALTISTAFANLYDTAYRDNIAFIVDPLLVAVLIVQLIALGEHRGLRWLESPTLRYFGKISYSIYLYQQLVPQFAERIRPAWSGLAGQVFVACVLVTILASLSFWLIEQPFLKLKNRFSAN